MRGREDHAARRSGLLPAIAVTLILLPATPSLASGSRDGATHQGALEARLRACLDHLPAAGLKEQLACLGRLRRAGPAASAATNTLAAILQRGDGATNHLLIAAILDVFRSLGGEAAAAAGTLGGLLDHRSRLYQDRDKMLVVRLRAYLMLTLGEIGYPPSALPVLLDVLGNLDERMTPFEVGAAARVVGSLGPAGCAFARYLLGTFTEQYSEEEFSLERYSPVFPARERTTIQLETVRAIGQVCSSVDEGPVAALRRLAGVGERGGGGLDPRVADEARIALPLVLSRRGAPPAREVK